jgi:putative flippase GtrA
MREVMRRYYEDTSWPYQLARYLTIGGFVFAIDIGSFALLLRSRLALLLVASIAYGLGILAHFTLNKYVNFRAHHRPLADQATTYGIVAFVCWLTTLAIVKLATGVGVPPLGAKVIAVALNIPIGFWGHRTLTFGHGIVNAVRRLR